MRRRAGDHARLRIVTAEAILAILAILALAACEDGENGSVKPTEQPSTGSAPAAALGGRIVFNDGTGLRPVTGASGVQAQHPDRGAP